MLGTNLSSRRLLSFAAAYLNGWLVSRPPIGWVRVGLAPWAPGLIWVVEHWLVVAT